MAKPEVKLLAATVMVLAGCSVGHIRDPDHTYFPATKSLASENSKVSNPSDQDERTLPLPFKIVRGANLLAGVVVDVVAFPFHFVADSVGSLRIPRDEPVKVSPKSAPKPTVPPKLATEISFKEPSGNNILDAGETGVITVHLTNSGRGVAYNVSAVVAIDGVPGLAAPAAVDIGDVGPGETKARSISIEGPHELGTGKARATIEVREGNGFDAATRVVEFQTQAFKAPALEVSAINIDGGLVRAGEVVQLEVSVRNSGVGPASDISADLDIKSEDIRPTGDTTAKIGSLEPGQTAKVRFEFAVNMRFKGKALPISLNISESWGKFGTNVPLNLALGEPAPPPKVLTVLAKPPAPALQGAHHAGDLSAPPYQLKERPADFAVVVGIDKYQSVPVADFADRDAAAVHAQLIAMGFPRRNIILLTRDKATKSSLAGYIEEWLPRNVTSESRVFFYYSGHGAPDLQSGEAYLVPWDGKPEFLQSSAYPLKQLYAALGRLKAKEVTVALDACFSGAGGRSVMAKGARPLVPLHAGETAVGNLTVFSAASGAQITGSLDEAEHGIFTYHFLKGLNGGAKDSTGRITAKGLYEYLAPRVQEDARRQNRDQTPGLSGDVEHVLVSIEP